MTREESETTYWEIFNSVRDGMAIIDGEQGTLVDVNPSLCRMYGYEQEEMIGLPVMTLIHRDYHHVFEAFLASVQSTGAFAGETVDVRKDGSTLFVEVHGSRVHLSGKPLMLAVVRDVTARKQAEEERLQCERMVRQARKMESLGTLAGGVAHDFNNVLGIISGFAELACLDAPVGSEQRSNLEQVMLAVMRGKEVAGQILAFSRNGDRGHTPMDLVPVLRASQKLLRATIPTTIDINVNLEVESAETVGVSSEIHEVLLHLCSNARQAMAESGGVLDMELAEKTIGPKELPAWPELSAGDFFEVRVRDTGEGVEEKILEQIFDPYFTTRPHGEGTGMGLAKVHGIVKQHKGAVRVRSQQGRGTTFRVLLPKMVDEGMPGKSNADGLLSDRRGRLLLVDDEAGLVRSMKRILERFGHTVVAGTDSVEALSLFQAHPEGFDLVITDMTMPRMTGLELSTQMLSVRPELPIVLCTGFSERISPEIARSVGIRTLLMKPVPIQDLLRTIQELLAEKDTA